MSIEKRTSQRIELDIPAGVRFKDSVQIEGRIENISADGMLLELHDAEFHRGSMVDINFKLSDRTWFLPALVMHSRGDKHGMMFASTYPELYYAAAHTPQPAPYGA